MAESPQIVLYHAPRTRSGTVLWLLEEAGLPFELRKLDLAAGEHKRPDFLAINPMGKVPALVWDGTAVAEFGRHLCLRRGLRAEGRSRSASRRSGPRSVPPVDVLGGRVP